MLQPTILGLNDWVSGIDFVLIRKLERERERWRRRNVVEVGEKACKLPILFKLGQLGGEAVSNYQKKKKIVVIKYLILLLQIWDHRYN